MKFSIIKTLLIFCVLSLLITSAFAQEKISFGKDKCAYCTMIIQDKLHATIAVDNDGKTYKFDAIEGLINFLKERNEADFQKLLIADYSNDGELTDALSATYLKSKTIPSPMGVFLSGFERKDVAEKVQIEKGGELYDWKQIKARFKDSRFGALDNEDHKHHDHNRPDTYAPIGIMGDHLHQKGDFMMSFRYMSMSMKGNLQESNKIGTSKVHSSYMVAPQKMTMDMYMLGVMYSPSPKVTMMIMQNIAKKQMDLVTRMGMNFVTESVGMGDIKVSALYHLAKWKSASLHFNSALNIPVGNIQNVADTPMGEGMRLPYAMQLGSGTYDLSFGGTYRGQTPNVSWGVQEINTIRTGENSQGYRFGNTFELNTWSAFRASNNLSFSIRVNGKIEEHINGMDERLNPMMVTTANTKNYGSMKVRSYLGVNFSFNESSQLHNLKLGLEGGLPLYQKVNGTQMNEKELLNLGIRYSI